MSRFELHPLGVVECPFVAIQSCDSLDSILFFSGGVYRRCVPFELMMRVETMKIESYEELRARLMRDPEVRGMIQKRAYEIYLHRGNQPGGEAHDWLQAESEILGQLMEQGSIAGVGSRSRRWDSNEQTATKK